MPQPKKILVADDEPELVHAVQARLEAAGYAVLTAKDGQQALEIALRERPDLITLDVLMPVMDGYACLRKLNAAVGRGVIPVIVLTSRDYMKDLFALEGVEDYVIKPFDANELLSRIEQIFSRRANPPAPPKS
jgi:DNA-binding response OmpR family regulator